MMARRVAEGINAHWRGHKRLLIQSAVLEKNGRQTINITPNRAPNLNAGNLMGFRVVVGIESRTGRRALDGIDANIAARGWNLANPRQLFLHVAELERRNRSV